MINDGECTLNNLNKIQLNITSKLSLEQSDRLDIQSQTSVLVHKKHKEQLDEELQEIPLRRGESVEFEQINDHSHIQNQEIIVQYEDFSQNSKKIVSQSNKQGSDLSMSESDISSNKKKSSIENINSQQLKRFQSQIMTIRYSEPKEVQKVSIRLLLNVKGFYRKLTKNMRILSRLTNIQHNFIRDVSTIFLKESQFKQYPNLIKFLHFLDIIKDKIQQFLQNIPLFSPYHVIKLSWDCFIACLILSVNFLLSLTIFFNMESDSFQQFFQFTFGVFLLNSVISLNTIVVVKGRFIQDRTEILKVYFKKSFFLTHIGIIPLYLQTFNVILESQYTVLINFLVLGQLYEFHKIVSRITSVLNYQNNMKNMIDLVRLVFVIVCVCHVFCSLWHGLAMHEISTGRTDTWLHELHLETEKSILIKYIYSFYYLSVTMVTVGYGDITPQNAIEVTFTILTMFVTGFFYAYSLNKVGKIISNIESKDKAYHKSMQVIHAFMRQENVNSELRVKVSNYLQYFYKESNEDQKHQESLIINQLSHQLKDDLMQNVKGKYLKEIPFIKQLNSKKKLISIMKELLFSPGEYIFLQNEPDDCSLFYLVKGEVEILLENENKGIEPIIIKTLHKQNYFGELSFLTGNRRSASVRASDFCRVYKIERTAFLDLIVYNAQDYETFCMIKEQIVFQSNLKSAKMQCYSCNSSFHILSECPKIHFTLSKHIIALKTFRDVPQIDRQYHERRKKSFHSLYILEQCINDAYKIICDEEFTNQIMNSSEYDEVEFVSNLNEIIQEYTYDSQNQNNTINPPIKKQFAYNKKPMVSIMNNIILKNQSLRDEEKIFQLNYQDIEQSKIEDKPFSDKHHQENSSQFTDNENKKQSYPDKDDNPQVNSSLNTNFLKQEEQGSIIKNNNLEKPNILMVNSVLGEFKQNSYEYLQSIDNIINQKNQFGDFSSIENSKNGDSYHTRPKSQTNNALNGNQVPSSTSLKKMKKNDYKKNATQVQEENKFFQTHSEQQIVYSDSSHLQQFNQQYQDQQLQQNIKGQKKMNFVYEQNSNINNSFDFSENEKISDKQQLFKQMKSKTINQQIGWPQKMQNGTNKIDPNYFPSDRKYQLDNKFKSFQREESIRLFDEKTRKFYKEETNFKVSHTQQDQFSSFPILDPLLKEFQGQRKLTPSGADCQTQQQLGRVSQEFAKKTAYDKYQNNHLQSQYEPNRQYNYRHIYYLEWEYFQFKYFEKAKVYEYYYPFSNFNLMFNKFVKNATRRQTFKNKQTQRTYRTAGQRRGGKVGQKQREILHLN